MESNISILKATEEDWEPAMEVAWRTFLKFEAPEYGQEGTDNFLSFISGEELFKMFLCGEYKTYVAKDADTVIGVGALRSANHVSLLFVDEKYHKKGIARGLIKALSENAASSGKFFLTVNAAPYAVEFYRKVGFKETDSMQKKDGITYLPMTCIIMQS